MLSHRLKGGAAGSLPVSMHLHLPLTTPPSSPPPCTHPHSHTRGLPAVASCNSLCEEDLYSTSPRQSSRLWCEEDQSDQPWRSDDSGVNLGERRRQHQLSLQSMPSATSQQLGRPVAKHTQAVPGSSSTFGSDLQASRAFGHITGEAGQLSAPLSTPITPVSHFRIGSLPSPVSARGFAGRSITAGQVEHSGPMCIPTGGSHSAHAHSHASTYHLGAGAHMPSATFIPPHQLVAGSYSDDPVHMHGSLRNNGTAAQRLRCAMFEQTGFVSKSNAQTFFTD